MKAIIGLEIHVQLSTMSKLFCSCKTEHEGLEPNYNTCPICLGFPGSKPRINKKAIEHGIKISKALNCRINPKMYFSRKSYFYPDMPKNFQITQFEIPLAEDGFLLLNDKKIGIRRVHIEEDPARLTHVGGDITSSKYNLIDYSRSGIPLAEIVTEPVLESGNEARRFLDKISLTLDYLGVYDPDKEGAMRIDANISIEGGQRVELKNITGFRNVEDAIIYEIIRQESMAKMGVETVRETRHYDANTNTTRSLRKKEYEDDYGYIFEPDLVEIEVEQSWIEHLVKDMPELPDNRIERFIEQYGVPRFQSNIIVNTGLDLSNFFEESCKLYYKPKYIANWIVTFLMKSLNYEGLRLKESKVRPDTFVELLTLIDEGVISERLAKEIIKEYVRTGETPRKIVAREGLDMMGREELIRAVKNVLADNQKALNDYRSGKIKVVDYLLGQVLRTINARADPMKIKKIIKETLDNK